MAGLAARRAVDAFRAGVRRPPVFVSDADAWGGPAVCEWKLPWTDGFELAENDDFIVALHNGGSRKVRAACNGPWSETTSTPGLISVIPPGRKVEYVIDGAVSFSSLHVPHRLLDGLEKSMFATQPDFRFAFRDPFASACMDVLLKQAHDASRCNIPYVNSVIRALVLHLMASFRSDEAVAADEMQVLRNDSSVKLDAMLDYIDSHLAQHLTLEGLADRAKVSRAHFARRFRAVTGLSPHRYITLRRVDKARELLRNPSLEINRIALDLGFGDQSHFTQVFRSATGTTPGQFRRTAGIAV